MIGSLWHDSRLMNVVAGLISLAAFLLLVVGLISILVHRSVFDIESVRLEGDLRHLSSAAVRTHALPKLRGNFFTMDLSAARTAFESVPWVRRASVRRIWPNQLSIHIEEHRPAAHWGDHALINGFGEVFFANIAEAETDGPLPVLRGPSGTERQVLQRFVEFQDWFQSSGHNPVDVRLSERFAWTVWLNNGLRLELGREQDGKVLAQRVGLFNRSYPVIKSQIMKTTTVVDLRYRNGFALRGEPVPLSKTSG